MVMMMAMVTKSRFSNRKMASSPDEFVPFKDREEYADLEPIPLPPSSNDIVSINYSAQYIDTMNYFRALYSAQEISPRALRHTELAIRLNPANYTAWFYRRRVLFSLNPPDALTTELTFLNEIIRKHEKNYQNWHHRQKLFERYVSVDPLLVVIEEVEEEEEDMEASSSSSIQKSSANWWESEKKFLRMMLRSDAKNYHLWSYRCWLFTHYFCPTSSSQQPPPPIILSIQQEELAFTEELLREDLRNNSVWNYRFFLTQRLHNSDDTLDSSTRLSEIQFALNLTKDCPYNESAWNYISGMWDFGRPYDGDISLRNKLRDLILDFTEVKRLEWQVRTLKYRENVHAMNVLLRVYLDMDEAKFVDECCGMIELLVVEDPIRVRYWEYLRGRVLKMGGGGGGEQVENQPEEEEEMDESPD